MMSVHRCATGWQSAIVGLVILAMVGPGGSVRALAQEAPAAEATETVSTTDLVAALPPGTTILQISEGDLRGRGTNDVAAMVSRSAKELPAPVVLLRDADGPHLTWLADLTTDERSASASGTVEIVDLNGEG